ncbi:DUF4430 domain-containing protein [Candidatus Nomurabacteria bacterium]|nr:DUF4430 domain-containing protein [Candidatus Nomurabacteria bacterium]
MFKTKKIILIVLLIACLGSIFVYKNIQKQNSRYIPPPFSSPYVGGGRVGVLSPPKTTPEIKKLDLKDDIPGETSVYDFMDKLRSEKKINFTEKEYTGMGKFIDSINEIKNNNSMSWIYYVNGVEASVGVSNYKIKIGDMVSWKYEKSNF